MGSADTYGPDKSQVGPTGLEYSTRSVAFPAAAQCRLQTRWEFFWGRPTLDWVTTALPTPKMRLTPVDTISTISSSHALSWLESRAGCDADRGETGQSVLYNRLDL